MDWMNLSVNIVYAMILTTITGTILTVFWLMIGLIMERFGYATLKHMFLRLVLLFYLCPLSYLILMSYSLRDHYRNMRLAEMTKHMSVAAVGALVLWAGVVLVMMFIFVHDSWVMKRYLKQAIPCEKRVLECFEEAAKQIKVNSKRVTLMESYYVTSPMIMGLIRAQIIIPVGKYSEEELRIFFLHELTHYKHRDMVLKRMMSFVHILHFYNPMVWWLNRQLQIWCECICDAQVYPVVGTRKYFETVTAMASGDWNSGLVARLAGRESEVEKRIAYMKRYGNVKKCSGAVAGILAAAMVVLSSSAVYAATDELNDTYGDAYEETLEKSQFDEENTDKDSGNIEQHFSDIALKDKPIVLLPVDSMTRSVNTFEWDVPADFMAETWDRFYVEAGEGILVSVVITPSEKYIDYGVVNPDHSLSFVHADDMSSHNFIAEKSGYYRIYIENDNDVPVNVKVSYIYR